LRDRIARGALNVDEALDIITQTAHAVAAAHEAGILHRDIKPANIMTTRRGESKLLDFGIAKLPGHTELTRTGTMVGTVAYMAPEQIARRAADTRSDVWALGVVFYEMLTQSQPFAAEHEAAVVNAIATAAPVPLRTLRPDMPAPFESVVARSLEKDPAARYQSVRAFLDGVDSLRPRATTSRVARHRHACEHWDESVAAGWTRRCAHCCRRSRRLVSPSHVSGEGRRAAADAAHPGALREGELSGGVR
jgi:eukaryotic-like serine/threonine-protein kinase